MKPDRSQTAPTEFLRVFAASLASDAFVSLALGAYRGSQTELRRVRARPLLARGQEYVSFVYKFKTKDVTKNVSRDDAADAVADLIGDGFCSALLRTTTEDVLLDVSRKGSARLRHTPVEQREAPNKTHDREKNRFVQLDQPFLSALGITNNAHRVLPSMSRKWKQINKFIEVLDGAFQTSGLAAGAEVRVVDYGCGKGYLTFAVYDYLKARGTEPRVTGVELREDLVGLCDGLAKRLGMDGLGFERGDIQSHAPGHLDVMIALHACDVATDDALYRGISAGASILMCSPCCHKQLRPQIQIPAVLEGSLRHGIHLGEEAEMLTDSLRVLLLEASGYDAQIFEFVSLEHTSKNKMILATRRPASNRKSENARRQIRDLKSFYGIRDHRLEALLEAGTDSPASFAERHPGISGAVTDSGSHPVDDQARPR